MFGGMYSAMMRWGEPPSSHPAHSHSGCDPWSDPEKHGETLRRLSSISRLQLRRNESQRHQRAEPDFGSAHVPETTNIPAEEGLHVEELREVASEKAQFLRRLLYGFGARKDRVT